MSKIPDFMNLIKSWETSTRPSWNEFFICHAYLASSRSSCSRLHVGCVLVKNNRIVSEGYNGFITGEKHKSFVSIGSDNKEHEMATVHAEQNAICYGANTGISLGGTIAYITHYPCINCAKILESCGITIVYYHEDYNNDPIIPKVCTRMIIEKI